MTSGCRIVTWNVHGCEGRDGRYDPGRIADVLAGLDADVIGLQEVDWRRPDHAGADQFAHLAERLSMTPVAGPNLRDHRGDYGNGLLSRMPVESAERIDLARPGREPRGAIDARLRLHGGALRAIVTHLGLQRAERRAQLDVLLEHVRGHDDDDAATVLMGDFNEWLGARALRRRVGEGDFPGAHLARSFPSGRPTLALDGFFVRPAPVRLDVRVASDAEARAASDHLPVIADLTWGSPDEAGAAEGGGFAPRGGRDASRSRADG